MVALLAVRVGQVIGRAAGEADIDFAGFAGAVDQAADHRQVHGFVDVLEARFQLVDGLDHVEVLP